VLFRSRSLPISARYKLDPCRFFAKAECKRAGGCTFSHDLVGNVHPRLQFLHGADEEGGDILHEADEEGADNVSSSLDSGVDNNFAEEAHPQDLAHELVPSIPYFIGVAVDSNVTEETTFVQCQSQRCSHAELLLASCAAQVHSRSCMLQ